MNRIAGLLTVFALGLVCSAQPATAQVASSDGLDVGLKIGDKIPPFQLKAQDGLEYDFNKIKGPKGAALLFHRSADWCPYCKTQLVQLQDAMESYKKQGLGVVAISYDDVAILQHFAQRMNIGYPLLSDKDSTVIRAFGILNDKVPQSSSQYGIPHPGMYIVDSSGWITARYFEEAYQERFTPDTILTREFGLSGLRETEVKTEHLTLTFGQTGEKVRVGNRITLTADLTMPAKMHVYAPGVEGYKPIALTFDPNPAVRVHATQFPESKALYLPAIKEQVPVYEGAVRISQDITFTSEAKSPTVELTGSLEYQACDDQICYIPKRVPIRFVFEIEGFDRTRVPENLRRTPEKR